jgi:hypothetical protein
MLVACSLQLAAFLRFFFEIPPILLTFAAPKVLFLKE